MNRTLHWILLLVLGTLAACGTESESQTASSEPAAPGAVETGEKQAPSSVDVLTAAIAEIPGRIAEDVSRDAGRKPAEVLSFLGVRRGMTVMDVFAANGWYSEVLSAAVGPTGRVIIQNPPAMLELRDGMYGKGLAARLLSGRLTNVTRLDRNMGELELDAETLDFALTALNFHDMVYLMSPESAAGALSIIHLHLKPGGVLGIIDHIGAPAADNAQLHRIDPQIIRDMAEAAGFVLEAESGILHNHNDDLTQVVFAPGIQGRTHRAVMRFRKPASH